MPVGKPEKAYIVAGCKSWNLRVFKEELEGMDGAWAYVSSPEELDKALASISPRYIFFLHWSWIVPEQTVEDYECVCFHMTDVPYGRGGSPLQNLIVNGHKVTKLTALKMVEELDAGPVYMKEDLSLEDGTAQDILIHASHVSAKMIKKIITSNPDPVPQQGTPVIFKRRTPEESEMPEAGEPRELYDHIRMLDAEGYPKAFIRYKGLKIEFSRASLYDDGVHAEVEIKLDEDMK